MRTLVTGGAGFIGSSLASGLLAEGHEVRVLDDLSTGRRENVPDGAELLVGSVTDEQVVAGAVAGVDVIFHEAANRAVLRSVEDPLGTDSVNTHGTLVVLDAALRAGVRRVVSASSSSVYGGAEHRPTPETDPLSPRSPYAVSKLAGEHYCRVFAELHGLETVSLRYFNVYGPRQRPDSAYAAVIPLFIRALLDAEPPTVHGDGLQSRDFTYVDDVVRANLLAASAPAEAASGKALNIAGGSEHSLLDLLSILSGLMERSVEPRHTEPRAGDVKHTCADVGAARDTLGFTAEVSFTDGLRRTVDWLSGRATSGAMQP
jgi:UDP-glucose 4-epimerase